MTVRNMDFDCYRLRVWKDGSASTSECVFRVKSIALQYARRWSEIDSAVRIIVQGQLNLQNYTLYTWDRARNTGAWIPPFDEIPGALLGIDPVSLKSLKKDKTHATEGDEAN